MRVLGLCSYPIESAATRFRLAQFIKPLDDRGLNLTLSPFLNGKQFGGFYDDSGFLRKAVDLLPPLFRRFTEVFDADKYDLILVQREALFFGPAIFEWLFQKIGKLPMVLDLDDATYIRYVSPSYGRLGSAFKFFGKTDKLIERADLVICGNRFIAEYVESKGTRSVIIPTVVDNDQFRPAEKSNAIPVIGWIGTPWTFPSLERLFPVLERLAEKHKFLVKIVGAGRLDIKLKGVETENLEWRLDRELVDFQSLDIGLYPIEVSKSGSTEWLIGKSGFKAVQYMAVGVPFVMSPVGVCAEIGESEKTHFNAETPEDWYNFLAKFLDDPVLRIEMGAAGREHSLKEFSLDTQADKFANALKSVRAES